MEKRWRKGGNKAMEVEKGWKKGGNKTNDENTNDGVEKKWKRSGKKVGKR